MTVLFTDQVFEQQPTLKSGIYRGELQHFRNVKFSVVNIECYQFLKWWQDGNSLVSSDISLKFFISRFVLSLTVLPQMDTNFKFKTENVPLQYSKYRQESNRYTFCVLPKSNKTAVWKALCLLNNTEEQSDDINVSNSYPPIWSNSH